MKTQNILAFAAGAVAGYFIFGKQNEAAVGHILNKWDIARITTGTYNTGDYIILKEYKTTKPLKKELERLKYPYNFEDISNGDEWNYYGKKLTLRLG